MQSKIDAFFKFPSASRTTSLPHDDDDDSSICDNKRHSIINTDHRNPNSPNSGSKPQSTVVKNKKRSYAQFHLDFGQSDFLLRSCPTCGIQYSPGNVDDEKTHKEFHKRYTQGIQFRGWANERVISVLSVKGNRIILVLQTDPSAHRKKVEEVVQMMEIDLGSGWIITEHSKVYLFVSLHRIVGCIVAETIKEAFKVLSSSSNAGNSDSTKRRKTKSSSTTLQFGNIVFQREVEKRAVSVTDSETPLGGALVCESEPTAAVCGIRAVWVTPSNRRKHIASQLLDVVRKSFCEGGVLERTQLAFSPPTSAGKALASSYTGTESFLVY